ncbi:HAD family hydrolase [Nocardiopsis sediminis]|uniref:Beta-phosphoglucomutase n=1 Tax=Nocardiopsis sediminis TaxID=1778267 RepID=A0ABV8FFR1_9ACTN
MAVDTPTDAVIGLDTVSAVAFDMDGVLTDTAAVHASAWKRAFDEFLRERAKATGDDARPFRLPDDYLAYVDGRERLDGVRTFLRSRGITLPEGGAADGGPDLGEATVASLGERKDRLFLEHIREFGVARFPAALALPRRLRAAGARVAVVSASRNCAALLHAAGLEEEFDVRVDGNDARRIGLPGKPDPALFLEAARRLDVPPERTAVVEDALAGVEAGRRGGFGLVVGVDRGHLSAGLYHSGAHVVVADLAELAVTGAAA